MLNMIIGIIITVGLCGFCLLCLFASGSGYEKTRIVRVTYVNCTEEEWIASDNQAYKRAG